MPSHPIKTHLPSVAQLMLSIIGLVTSLCSAAAILLLQKIGTTVQSFDRQADQSIYLVFWVTLIISLVSIPSLVLSIRRLARVTMKPAPIRPTLLIASAAFLIILPLAYWINTAPGVLFSNLFLKISLSCVLVTIPLWWFIELGQNKLPKSSPQRFWGLINFQIYAGLPLVIVVEVILLSLGLFTAGLWLANHNTLKPLWMTLQTQLMIAPDDLSLLVDQIRPLLQDSGILVGLYFSVVILTPVVEEFLKPLALWFFIKNEWSEAEGFSAGLVCGAAFALVESVSSIAALSEEDWIVMLIARVGTGLLHTLTAGLSGWALVSAWKTGRYKRLAVTYLISISLHGVWNFFAMLSGLGSDFNLLANTSFDAFSKTAPWFLGSLFAVMMAMLFVMNRRIRKTTPCPPPIPPLPL